MITDLPSKIRAELATLPAAEKFAYMRRTLSSLIGRNILVVGEGEDFTNAQYRFIQNMLTKLFIEAERIIGTETLEDAQDFEEAVKLREEFAAIIPA